MNALGAIPRELLELIRAQYELDWYGLHGIEHFMRVRDNGLKLAESTGADKRLIELFAIFHDSRRINDRLDPDHGPRASQFVKRLHKSLDFLTNNELELLAYACEHHTSGLTEGDVTVQTCWDADRLDLGRAGIIPRSDRLCTDAAKSSEIMEWAYKRSIGKI